MASRIAKMCFQQGLCPDPARGDYDAPPEPLVEWVGDTHLIPHPIRRCRFFHLRRSTLGVSIRGGGNSRIFLYNRACLSRSLND